MLSCQHSVELSLVEQCRADEGYGFAWFFVLVFVTLREFGRRSKNEWCFSKKVVSVVGQYSSRTNNHRELILVIFLGANWHFTRSVNSVNPI